MTRALADGATHDHWLKYHRFFKGCKDYDESDIKRGSSRIGVGSTVLIHTPQPVGVCGKLYSAWKGYYKVLKEFPDNPNVYLVCQETDSKRQKLVHKDLIRVVEVADENKEAFRNQQSLGTQPVGVSDPTLEKCEIANHKESTDDAEKSTLQKKKTRSGRTY